MYKRQVMYTGMIHYSNIHKANAADSSINISDAFVVMVVALPAGQLMSLMVRMAASTAWRVLELLSSVFVHERQQSRTAVLQLAARESRDPLVQSRLHVALKRILAQELHFELLHLFVAEASVNMSTCVEGDAQTCSPRCEPGEELRQDVVRGKLRSEVLERALLQVAEAVLCGA